MKVAKILDLYNVVITKTDGPHLRYGDILVIHSEPVIDPETGENLGELPTLRVKVTEIYDKFILAETYRMAISKTDPAVVINIGDTVTPFQVDSELPF